MVCKTYNDTRARNPYLGYREKFFCVHRPLIWSSQLSQHRTQEETLSRPLMQPIPQGPAPNHSRIFQTLLQCLFPLFPSPVLMSWFFCVPKSNAKLERAKLKEGGYLSPEFRKNQIVGQNNSNNTLIILEET